jgi:protein-S-isoprenylcysteine O-methyltransferase Ste14
MNDRTARIALFFEDRIAPFIFGYCALARLQTLFLQRENILGDLRNLFHGTADVDGVFILNLNLALLVLNVSTTAALLLKSKTPQKFKHPREVFVPLLGIFIGLMFNSLVFLPDRLNVYLAPQALLTVLTASGLALSLSGVVISTIGVCHLRSSFSLLVEQRSIVSHGIYSLSRHPIYFEHSLRLIGCFLMNLFLPYLILMLAALTLLVFRAVLEERKLLQGDPTYRRYLQRTPSLFLRFFGLDANRLPALGRRAVLARLAGQTAADREHCWSARS